MFTTFPPIAVSDNEGRVCTWKSVTLTIQPLQNYLFNTDYKLIKLTPPPHTHTVSPLFLNCILVKTISTEMVS